MPLNLATPLGADDRNAVTADAEGRSDADLAAHEAAIIAAMALHLDQHDRIALSYSGGAESGLLLHLLRPLRDRFTALWVNPGVLPHEAEHVRRQAAGGPFAEVASDRAAFWQQHGMPSPVVPSARLSAIASDVPMAGPPIAPMSICCTVVRGEPGNAWCRENGVSLLIHGQRRGEGSGLFAPAAAQGFSMWAPLARWSRAEVMRRVAHHGVPLPLQYAEGAPTTFECAICPANLSPARLAFLRQHYPAEHAETVRLAGVVMRDVASIAIPHWHALEAAEAAL